MACQEAEGVSGVGVTLDGAGVTLDDLVVDRVGRAGVGEEGMTTGLSSQKLTLL